MIRLGAPISAGWNDPGEWATRARELGYSAVYSPFNGDDPRANDDRTVRAFRDAAEAAGLFIGEVGVWHTNLISADEAERDTAAEAWTRALRLADRIGAGCCVGLAGSRAEQWWEPHPDNLTPDTFALLTEQARRVIDAVRPERTTLALEPMPWTFPTGIDDCRALLDAVDRPRFGVHLDLANWMDQPRRFLEQDRFIDEVIATLGPHVFGCHLKDVQLRHDLPAHLRECRPGLGGLNLRRLLERLDALPQDVPVLLEHLETDAEYRLAFEHVLQIAPRRASVDQST